MVRHLPQALEPPQVIEIFSSSSSAPSPPVHPMNGGRHDDDDHVEQRRVSAASRVSLANLLGPTGPGSSPYASPSGGSPRKRFSEVQSSDARAHSPPYQTSSPSASRTMMVAQDGQMPSRSAGADAYPDSLGESSSRAGHRRLSRGSPSVDAVAQDQAPPTLEAGSHARGTAVDGGSATTAAAAASDDGGRHQEDRNRTDDVDDDDDDDKAKDGEDDSGASSDGGCASEAEAGGEAGKAGGGGGADGENSRTVGTSKVKRRARRRTPSPPAPIAPLGPPARPTIRISLSETKKDGYLINVPSLVYARLKTERHPWATWFESQMDIVDDLPAPPPPAPDVSAGLGDVGGGLTRLLAKYPAESGGGAPAPRKRRRAVADDDVYDTEDPFVDDSELGVDEPTHFAKPKADGFYVTQGPVELAKVKPTRGRGGALGGVSREKIKPLSIRDSKSGFVGSINKLIAKRGQITTAGPVAPPPSLPSDAPGGGSGSSSSSMQVNALLNGNGTSGGNVAMVPLAGSPPPRGNDAAGRQMSTEGSRESPIKVDEIDENAPRSKKPRYPKRPVDPRLQAAFENLRTLVAGENFAVKTKFPPALRAPLVETAKLAVELGEYNDNFFNYLPTIFPYNRFTMMKLTKREFFPHHIKYFKDLQDEHMEVLGRLLRESFPQQLAEYEAAHKAWEERGGPEHEGEGDAAQANGTANGAAAMDVDGAAPPLTEEEQQEPQKRWKWTEEMREEVYTLINIENAMSEVRNEKLKLENAAEQFSEINARKSCYKAMAELFPEEGWTTSTNISREYAQLKKKKDRQEARLGAEMDDSRASSMMP